jgi:hypothetical protein
MTGMPPQNPLSAIARDSIGMAKDTGDKKFQLFAMIAMGVSGLVAIMHSVQMIYRDLKPKREAARPEPAEQRHRPAEYDDEPPRHDDSRETSWVHKARLAEQPEGGKSWTEHSGQGRQARQH